MGGIWSIVPVKWGRRAATAAAGAAGEPELHRLAAVGAAEKPEPCMPAVAGVLPAGAEPGAWLVVELGAEPAVELGAVAGLLPGVASVCRIRYRI